MGQGECIRRMRSLAGAAAASGRTCSCCCAHAARCSGCPAPLRSLLLDTPLHPPPSCAQPSPNPLPPTGPADIDREVLALQREEAKLISEIKAAAKAGNTPATRVLAKSLVRLRGQIAQLRGSSAQLRGVGTSITVRVAAWAGGVGVWGGGGAG